MSLDDQLRDVVHAVKPRLRGWLHMAMFPAAVIAGLVLVIMSPQPEVRIGAAVYTGCAALLFGISAMYHRGTWSPRAQAALKRFDHANIFLIIAGTYTPFALLLLPGAEARTLLTLVWIAAVLGVAFRVFWVGAPRWLYVPVYVGMGWVAVFWLPAFSEAGGAAVVTLIISGGLLYTIGAIVYGIKRPNPSPRWFGFHEVFHAFTLAAFTSHHVGIWLAAFGIGAGAAATI